MKIDTHSVFTALQNSQSSRKLEIDENGTKVDREKENPTIRYLQGKKSCEDTFKIDILGSGANFNNN
jgi:hypothetical protein